MILYKFSIVYRVDDQAKKSRRINNGLKSQASGKESKFGMDTMETDSTAISKIRYGASEAPQQMHYGKPAPSHVQTTGKIYMKCLFFLIVYNTVM